jgi:hypothetical protein
MNIFLTRSAEQDWQRNFFSVKAPKRFHRDMAISLSG